MVLILFTLKAIKPWNEIQSFIKIDIYSPKTYSEFLKSVENYSCIYIVSERCSNEHKSYVIGSYTVMKAKLCLT